MFGTKQKAKCDLGQRIRDGRKAKNLNQQELAEKLDLQTTTVVRWENGSRVPSMRMMAKIAKVLGIKITIG